MGTQLATGLGGAIGSRVVEIPSPRLVFVEYNGHVSSADLQWASYSVLGGGYTTPEDVVVASDGDTAYVSERTGDVVRISLSGGADRSAATVVVSGLASPQQLALDEMNGWLYAVEFADPGRLVRIDLATAGITEITSVTWGIGVLLPDQGRFGYITEQTPSGQGILSRVDLTTGARTELFASQTAPLFMLSWSGANQILVTERDPANIVWSIDLAHYAAGSPVATPLVVGTPARPSSANVGPGGTIAVCCDAEIDSYPGQTTACVPGYEPSDWNDADGIQYNNNCYNYATNIRTDTFAQPGQATGDEYTELDDCVGVDQGAQSDGLRPTDCDAGCTSGCCHQVALVVWPGTDFHWYRLGPDGFWSHKPGGTEATHLDNSGNPITDPRTADRGGYTTFCGCYCVCRGEVVVT